MVPSMYTLQPRVRTSSSRSSISPKAARLSHQRTSTGKPYFREIQEHLSSKLGQASNAMNSTYQQLLDSFVDHTFTFKRQHLRPTESNFAPVDEIGEITQVIEIEGEIPADFPDGVYIRNGGNPLYGALQSVSSIFGQSHNIWVEGEGMLHALYFCKTNNSTWSISYNNRYVQSETFRIEKERQKPCFLPMTDGNPPAMLIASVLNTVWCLLLLLHHISSVTFMGLSQMFWKCYMLTAEYAIVYVQLRFQKVMKSMSNTSVFEHAGRVYAASEDDVPHEVDLHSLGTLGSWHLGGEWKLPFTAHPKVIPGSKEMVIFGINAVQPFLTVGIISEDGEKLKQKVGLKLDRCTYCHEIGVTGTYNIIIDSPLTLNPARMLRGAPVLGFEEESYSRIGVMPHYGDADSVIWFYVEPFCTFHLVNCFEEGHEVVVRGFHVPSSAIMGPRQKNLAMDTSSQEPNEENFSRLYAYVQVADCSACFGCGHEIARPKFLGFAKLCLEEKQNIATKIGREDLIKVEYHQLAKNQFCSGVTFVPKATGVYEDDGWIVSFVHDEETNISKVHIIDTRNFESGPIAKITLPQRVPYGLHGAFITKKT
uniref:Carotenoid cleavage dioxygenase n=1 Tax=Oryza punctata TaxID=4537 RepID=A0A0E0LUB1_ORYPU